MFNLKLNINFCCSSRNCFLATSFVVGAISILASIFAVTSGRWIRVYEPETETDRSRAREAAILKSRKLNEREDSKKNSSANLIPSARTTCCYGGGGGASFHQLSSFNKNCLSNKRRNSAIKDKIRDDDVISSDDKMVEDEENILVREAFVGISRVCFVHNCIYDSTTTMTTTMAMKKTMMMTTTTTKTAVCYKCSNDDDNDELTSLKRSPSACHVIATVVQMAVNAEANKILLIFIVATAILFCGVSLGAVGSFWKNGLMVAAAFLDSTAGLLQLLALFLFAMIANDEIKSTNDDDQKKTIDYSYDCGSLYAVLAFIGSNMAAVMATYSYRGLRPDKEALESQSTVALIVKA